MREATQRPEVGILWQHNEIKFREETLASGIKAAKEDLKARLKQRLTSAFGLLVS